MSEFLSSDPIDRRAVPLETGLSQAEAETRLKADGPNALPAQARQGLAGRLAAPLREPAYQLLILAAALYLWLGDWLEGAFVCIAAVLAAGIAVAQDLRTERTLSKLRSLASPRAVVRRDGVQRRIAATELARGDIVLLQAGDRVPADGVLHQADGLTVDESLITGESLPVDKRAREAAEPDAASSRLLSGTLVSTGEAVMEVTGTGARSAMGRIGALLRDTAFEAPRLNVQMRRLVRLFAVLSVIVSASLFAVLWASGTGQLQAGLQALALAIALVPEEIPLVITVFTVMGALRIARTGVLARKAAAIETLGQVTVLCVDKTGTLTENRMRVAESWAAEGFTDTELLRLAAAACGAATVDPMEKALIEAAGGPACAPPSASWPFDRASLAMGNLRDTAGGPELAIKGAPETTLEWLRCDRPAAERAVREMASRGRRVIAVGRSTTTLAPGAPLCEADADLVGLVGLADPIRPAAASAVARFAQAGVRVVMITGDHPETASAIARQAGIAQWSDVMEGAAFSALTDAGQADAAGRIGVFARVLPEQKLTLVDALKQAGEIVAMIGDGVNDAPALKSAHIGVAMGARGSDVAREAAALVLVDDDLSALAETFAQGRRISENIRKALAYIFSIHVLIAGAALAPPLAGWPPLLLPLHVILIEFLVDPTCAIVLEADRADEDLMCRAPRRSNAPIFGVADMALCAVFGLIALGAVMAAYAWALRTDPPAAARATAFIVVMAMNLALLLATRARGHQWRSVVGADNPLMPWALAAIVLIATAAATFGPAMTLLGFSTPDALIAAVCALGAAVLLTAASPPLQSILPRPGKPRALLKEPSR